MFDEDINFLHCSWTLDTQENHQFVVYFLLMSVCVCVVGWLKGHLYRSQIWKRVRRCCNSPWFTSHCTESTVINSESETSYILPLHSCQYLLSITILSTPTLICSSRAPQRKIVFIHLSQSLLLLYILPNFQALTVNLSLFTMSLYFLPAFVHLFHSVVQGVKLDINLPQMSPTHQTAHGCLSGVG